MLLFFHWFNNEKLENGMILQWATNEHCFFPILKAIEGNDMILTLATYIVSSKIIIHKETQIVKYIVKNRVNDPPKKQNRFWSSDCQESQPEFTVHEIYFRAI